MIQSITQENLKNRKLQFLGLYAVSIFLLTLIITAFWRTPFIKQQEKAATYLAPPINDAVQNAYNQLLAGVQKLQQLDKEYISNLKDSSVAIPPEKIANAENTYIKAVENINKMLPNYKADDREKMKSMIAFFNVAFQQHTLISNLYYENGSNSLKTNPNSQSSIDLQNSVRAKDSQIADLQRKLQERPSVAGNNNQSEVIDDLQKRNERLKAAVTVLENKNWALIRSESQLQKNMEVLMTQLRSRQK